MESSSVDIVINGRFKILEQMVDGGQAEVYKTLDLSDNKMYLF